MKIDFGCGPYCKDDHLGVDIYPFDGVHLIYDKTSPLPLNDDSVDEVYSMHTFEHLDDIFFTINELFRVSKDGARWSITSPHFSSCRNFWDLEHKKQFGSRTFEHIYGKSPIETLVPHAVNGWLLNRGIEYDWWEYRTLALKPWWKRAIIQPFRLTLNAMANANPFFCDRVWCRFVGGFDNIAFHLEVCKKK